jgi:hypothetical protein
MVQPNQFAVLEGNHLREHPPKMYRALQQSGQIQAFLQERAESAEWVFGNVVEQGTPWLEAWELAKDEIYLPTEADVPNL